MFGSNNTEVDGYCDADYAGDVHVDIRRGGTVSTLDIMALLAPPLGSLCRLDRWKVASTNQH
jgi:hypothetical protein